MQFVDGSQSDRRNPRIPGLAGEVASLKRRLFREATMAIDMLERALEALWAGDAASATAVRQRDDRIDLEEVAIEQQCYRLMTMEHPIARDFRVLAFILRVNADVERVADHAVSISKIVQRMDGRPSPQWPTALRELGNRVPLMCHALLRAVMDEDLDEARRLVRADSVIDGLDAQIFEESKELMRKDADALDVGMYAYRIGRELERVGDLMAGIAEDVVYLVTGEIIRHEKRRRKAGA